MTNKRKAAYFDNLQNIYVLPVDESNRISIWGHWIFIHLSDWVAGIQVDLPVKSLIWALVYLVWIPLSCQTDDLLIFSTNPEFPLYPFLLTTYSLFSAYKIEVIALALFLWIYLKFFNSFYLTILGNFRKKIADTLIKVKHKNKPILSFQISFVSWFLTKVIALQGFLLHIISSLKTAGLSPSKASFIL